ncbi:PHB depolymerase family esterase [Amycolatopsis sp.]|uniref:extracellular catalytic domain type 1 short-chain-length polyhydroxyalkanoate depolymerase n=1 Tax=Amycolatopsis sp. TaxID=37632 RepID=UPI002E071B79|nr:PHB depolymerase family esterase [Amycolatopsis sp.]
MKRRLWAVLALVMGLAVLSPPVASAAAIGEVTGFGSNPGNLKMFRYTPDGLPAGRPVVVVMHGCTQDAAGYGTNSGWVQLAQRWSFTVVLPQQQTLNNSSKCFNWFASADITRGQGEALSIKQMTDRAVADAGASRVFATGLSAGGAMTSVMLATYPETFAGGGVVAGLPYACATSLVNSFSCMNPGQNLTPAQWGAKVRAASGYQGPWPTMSVWHGTSDFTVAQANKTEIVDQWTNVNGADAIADVNDTVGGYPHAVYRDAAGRTVVQAYTITGMGHGQPVDPGTGAQQCGTAAAYVLDVNVCAAWQLGHSWGLDT